MIDKILEICNHSNFDFREYVNPNDELLYLFDQWVDYYRLKYAICKAINPKSILEIGVRYGYSAITFLKAAPEASYSGVDNDSDTFGGSVGAINWARKITKGYKTSFIIDDTQNMSTLPGEQYDLIHIDGQQDGDGTFHDLEMALEKGKYILVDGYFWSNENMLSSTFFLKKYMHLIDYTITIPGYAGDLIIKTKDSAKSIVSHIKKSKYDKIRGSYDNVYYLTDCGGYGTFSQYYGHELDGRLTAVYNIVAPKKDENILDIGCGRGELAFKLAQAQSNVIGIDYSGDAVKIAVDTYREYIGKGLSYLKGDILYKDFEQRFDKIVMSDVVEHIEQNSLEKVLEKISSLLNINGYLVIHTSPNKLNYDYEYKEKIELAKAAGTYLPANPRTYYEDMMHINEQTPESLEETLRRYFRYVLVWVTSLPDNSGSLVREYNFQEMCRATSIFAIASNDPIENEKIISLISQQKLNEKDVDIEITCKESISLSLVAGKSYKFNIIIKNKGNERIVSLYPYPVNISYHWLNGNGEQEVFDGIRTPIKYSLGSNEEREFEIDVVAPKKIGKYKLQITLVQEQCFWLEELLDSLPYTIDAEIK